MNDEFSTRLQRFIDTVELVFDNDWYYTQNLISDEDFISNNGTFLNPFPGEHFTGGKGDNWANRSSFLAAYRELKAFAISEGLYDPDAET
jgi:hypothetical protein